MSDTNLKPKQIKFCEEYLVDLNATQAAIRAGYSEKTACSIGWENLRKPEIKNFIAKALEERHIKPEETLKALTDIAKGSINDYLVVRKVERRQKIRKPLAAIIAEHEAACHLEEKIAERLSLDGERLLKFQADQLARKEDIVRMQVELEYNPEAYRIVLSEPVLEEVADVDLVKLAKDKEHGRIKSISFTEFGPKVELYPADSALNTLAKVQGLFEKDNLQKSRVKVGFVNTDDDE